MRDDAIQSRRATDGVAVFILGGYSLVQFLRKSGTAWDWPALDMAPLVARQLDASFLTNDFFTNASAEPNARHIFGRLLLTVAQGFGGDWYAAMFLLKVLAVVLLPVLWYLVISGWAMKWFERDAVVSEAQERDIASFTIARNAASILAFVAALLVIRPSWGNTFSIAWWSPFQPQATSATYAQMLALAGSSLAMVPSRVRVGLAIGAWFFASLLHPAIGLFMLVLHGIAVFDTVRLRDVVLVAGACWVVPCAIVAVAYRPEVSLTADEFIRHYVVGHHAAHYWPAEFGTLTGKPWWRSFAMVGGAMLAAAVCGMATRNRRFATLALLCGGSYVGCVALQYVVVVAWPNKLLATIGPVRFSAVGYWEAALLLAIAAGDFLRRRTGLHSVRRVLALWGTSGVPRSWGVLVLLAAAMFVGVARRDDPLASIRGENADFYAWVDASTEPGSVFLAGDSGLCVDVALAGGRGVFAGFGFPFREDFFAEHSRRHELAYGTPGELAQFEGATRGERSGKFFRTRRPADFVRMSEEYRLDYVVIERPSDAEVLAEKLPEGFARVRPRFAGEKFFVYAIDDWKGAGG